MKTAMELALARIEMLYIEKDSIHWEMFKNDCMEKEKEQIIKDYHKGQMGIVDLYEESFKKIGVYEEMLTDFEDAEEYYNQTYNQNK
jgi:hypothetical protein